MTTKIANLITTLYNPDAPHSTRMPTEKNVDSKRLLLRCLINSLTSAACNALMSHLYEERNPQSMVPEEPTLDERNEQDAKIRGAELEDEHVEEIGAVVAMKPYQVALVTNSLRYRLYEECLSLSDDYVWPTPKCDPLVDTPMPVFGAPINYDQPMSARDLLKYRANMATNVDEEAVSRFASLMQAHMGVPDDADEAAMQLLELRRDARIAEKANGEKDRSRLLKITPAVIGELKSMRGADDIDDQDVVDSVTGLTIPFGADTYDRFQSLPLMVQQKIGKGVLQKLNNAYTTTYRRVRTDPSLITDCTMILAHTRTVKLWLDDVDHLIAMQSAEVGVPEHNGVTNDSTEVAALGAAIAAAPARTISVPKGSGKKTRAPKAAVTA